MQLCNGWITRQFQVADRRFRTNLHPTTKVHINRGKKKAAADSCSCSPAIWAAIASSAAAAGAAARPASGASTVQSRVAAKPVPRSQMLQLCRHLTGRQTPVAARRPRHRASGNHCRATAGRAALVKTSCVRLLQMHVVKHIIISSGRSNMAPLLPLRRYVDDIFKNGDPCATARTTHLPRVRGAVRRAHQ